MKIRAFIALVSVLSMLSPANAAISVYGANVFSTTGAVTSPGNALGPSDGTGALIGNGGVLVLQFDEWLLGDNISIATLPNGFFAGATVSIGHVVNGVATFSAPRAFNSIFSPNPSFDFSADCTLISANGCDLLRIETTATFISTGLLLDGVVGSAPELATWVMMIVGFGLTAWRLKASRSETCAAGMTA